MSDLRTQLLDLHISLNKHVAQVEELALDQPPGSPLRSMLAALAVRLAHVAQAVKGIQQTREVAMASGSPCPRL